MQPVASVGNSVRLFPFNSFTAQRYVKRGICRRRVSLCVSVTHRYCIKTAKRRIRQITPHDSPMTSFLMPKITAKFERDHPLRGAPNAGRVG